MDAAFGAAIVARRPAALEAPVDDMAVAAGGTDGGDRGFEVARAGRSAVCADVELRQVAVEQARDMAADRMGGGEDDGAVQRAQRSGEDTSELQSLMRSP